jgi:hypothetical protein
MENKLNKKIGVVNLSGDYLVPTVNENRTRKPWVEFGVSGADDFFSTIIKKYFTSPTQQACVDGCTQLLYGKGLMSDDEATVAKIDELTEQEEIKKIVNDYKLFGQLAIQVTFSPDRKSVIGFYHMPIDTLRAEKCDDYGNINGYYYSPDWSNTKIKPRYIPAFESGEYENDVQVLVIKRYVPGMFYYGLPDYYSCLQYCAVEGEISNLHVNNITNGFLPSCMINFNGGSPPPEEQYLLEASIANKFAGTSNAGRFILSFNENKDEATTIDMLKTENLHDQYRFLSEEARDKIMLAHRITSKLLFGITSATGFSSNADELKTSYGIFSEMVISPMQEEIIKAFKKILALVGVDDKTLRFEKLVPYEVEADMVEQVGEEKADEIINETNEEAIDETLQPTQDNEVTV